MERLFIRQTREFSAWKDSLRDKLTRQRIDRRLSRLAYCNFGDTKAVGGGIAELRFAFGPGYRIYYSRIGDTVVVLLCGGDKSGQSRDIEQAKRILTAGDWK